ncbi:MAG: aldo/keto reductase, partial [Bacteroidota bacterium]
STHNLSNDSVDEPPISSIGPYPNQWLINRVHAIVHFTQNVEFIYTMQLKPIGRSGLIGSTLTLGTMIFGEQSNRSTPEKEAIEIINHYLEAGGNHIDTADVYAQGRSEEIVGKALEGRRQEVIIATKVRFPTGQGPNQQGLSRHHITEGVHQSLRRLKSDYIDLLYVHCWDPITPLTETLRTLEDLIRSGKVRYIGISNFKAWQLMKAQGLCDQFHLNRFIAAQYQYSLVKRDIEYEFFDLMEAEGLGLLPWGPLGGGFLTGKYQREQPTTGRISTTADHTEESWDRRNTEQNWAILDLVKQLAEKHQASPTQIAIAWILSKKIVASVILGVRTLAQLQDNLAAQAVQLSSDEIASLDTISALPEWYPYRMIEAYGQRTY